MTETDLDLQIDVYIGKNDKLTPQPIKLGVSKTSTISQLKSKIECQFKTPKDCQIWIIRCTVCYDDQTLESILESDTKICTAFLCHLKYNPQSSIIDQIDKNVRDAISKHYSNAIISEKRPFYNAKPPAVDAPPPTLVEAGSFHQPVTNAPSSNASFNSQPNPTTVGELSNEWQCKLCTLMNLATSLTCETCDAGQPDEYKAELERLRMNEIHSNLRNVEIPQEAVDWECSICTAVNLEASKTCEVCDSLRLPTQKSSNPKVTLPAAPNGAMNEVQTEDCYLNSKNIFCEICQDPYPPGEGIILQSCTHEYCKACIVDYLKAIRPEQVGKCPKYGKDFPDCHILPTEARALLQGDYKMYEEKGRLQYTD